MTPCGTEALGTLLRGIKTKFEWSPTVSGDYNWAMSTLEIRDLALRLPPEDRALIARDLLASLHDEEPAEEVEAAWVEEIEARAEAYEAGLLPAEDWEVSLERVRQRLREGRSR
jgi:putative addiction module component (TIGR02574 family)